MKNKFLKETDERDWEIIFVDTAKKFKCIKRVEQYIQ